MQVVAARLVGDETFFVGDKGVVFRAVKVANRKRENSAAVGLILHQFDNPLIAKTIQQQFDKRSRKTVQRRNEKAAIIDDQALARKGLFGLSKFALGDLLDVQSAPLVKIVIKPLKLNIKRLEKFLQASELLLVGGNEVDWTIFNNYNLSLYYSLDVS